MEYNKDENKQLEYDTVNEIDENEMLQEDTELQLNAPISDTYANEQQNEFESNTDAADIIDAEYEEQDYREIPVEQTSNTHHEHIPNFVLYENNTSEGNASENNTSKKSRKQSKKTYGQGQRTALLALSCLLLGGIGGVSGTYLMDHFTGGRRTAVLYQGVDQVDNDGNKVTNLSVKCDYFRGRLYCHQ